MSMSELLAVAAGGVTGAVARYLVYIAVGYLLGMGFPYATLIVNVVGSFAMGVLVDPWPWSGIPRPRCAFS